MISQHSILSLTSDQYAKAISSDLGKGYQHASIIYEQFIRSGELDRLNPAFANAQKLFDQIVELTDFTYPSMLSEKNDGNTGKFLVCIPPNLEVESVVIPMKAGSTLCISSQVGCRMGCAFCETGRMGLLKNLTATEIVSQVYLAKHHLKVPVRNIVFMGMGEPFDNYDAVIQAARVLMDPLGFGFGRGHITISTSGCVESIDRFRQEPGDMPNLAVSITAPNDELRNRLMPVNRKVPLSRLYEGMKAYCDETGKQILIAYVLLDGVNDTLELADQLADYLQGLNVKVNLIPYNPQTRDRFRAPPLETLEAFMRQLRKHGLYTLLRVTKGDQIMAACGQLGNVELRKTVIKRLIDI